MALLIETTLWVDYTRAHSPRKVKELVAPYILDTDSFLAEPVVFEMYRAATASERVELAKLFELIPVLKTPEDIWMRAAELGQACRDGKYDAGALDLLIAAVALEHDAEVVTFDQGFLKMAKVSELRVRILTKVK